MKNLTKAIINVMKSVKGMEKNSRIGTGKFAYDGTKDYDVKLTFNQALVENGLCIIMDDIDDTIKIERWVDSDGKTKQSIFTSVKVKYILIHESGEFIELMGYGHGVDSQDKGAGKAITYALKNCLLNTFLTPVGKMPDTDQTHSDDIETKPEESKKHEAKDAHMQHAIKRIKAGVKEVIKNMSTSFILTDVQNKQLLEAQHFYNEKIK